LTEEEEEEEEEEWDENRIKIFGPKNLEDGNLTEEEEKEARGEPPKKRPRHKRKSENCLYYY
jgi:hypothetical protein